MCVKGSLFGSSVIGVGVAGADGRDSCVFVVIMSGRWSKARGPDPPLTRMLCVGDEVVFLLMVWIRYSV